jgi:hypothetical protein
VPIYACLCYDVVHGKVSLSFAVAPAIFLPNLAQNITQTVDQLVYTDCRSTEVQIVSYGRDDLKIDETVY